MTRHDRRRLTNVTRRPHSVTDAGRLLPFGTGRRRRCLHMTIFMNVYNKPICLRCLNIHKSARDNNCEASYSVIQHLYGLSRQPCAALCDCRVADDLTRVTWALCKKPQSDWQMLRVYRRDHTICSQVHLSNHGDCRRRKELHANVVAK